MRGLAALLGVLGLLLAQVGAGGAGPTLLTLAVTLFGTSLVLPGGGGGSFRLPLIDRLLSPQVLGSLPRDLGLALIAAFAWDDLVRSPLSLSFLTGSATGRSLAGVLGQPALAILLPLVLLAADQLLQRPGAMGPLDVLGVAAITVLVVDRAVTFEGLEFAAFLLMVGAVVSLVAFGHQRIAGEPLPTGIAGYGVVAIVAALAPLVFDYVRATTSGELLDPGGAAANVVGVVLALLVAALVVALAPRAAAEVFGYVLVAFSVVNITLLGNEHGPVLSAHLDDLAVWIVAGTIGSMIGRRLAER